jgi:hypothetical protein
MKNTTPRPFSIRAAGFGLAGVLGASLLVTLVPSQVVSAEAPAGEYIVTFDASSNLNSKLRKEMQLGNTVTDVFTSAADGFVATLDSADVARLRTDSDVSSIELNKVIRLVDDAPVTNTSAVAGSRYIVRLKSTASFAAAASIAGAVGATLRLPISLPTQSVPSIPRRLREPSLRPPRGHCAYGQRILPFPSSQ